MLRRLVTLSALFFALAASADGPVHLEQVLSLARISELDGRADSQPLSPPRWRQAVFEVRREDALVLGWPRARRLALDQVRQFGPQAVPLGLLHALVERRDEAGAFQTTEVFALGALKAHSYYGQHINLVLPSSAILQHGVAPLQHLEIDAGDGRGFRPFSPDTPLNVSYPDTGTKTVRIRTMRPNGVALESAATFEVVRGTTPDPTETWQITASETWDGEAGTGQAYVYLAAGRTELTNPVVVIEGFDLDNTMDWPVLYDLLNQENLLEDLRADGFDAVVLDFTEAVDPIQRNAFVVTELLDQVRATIPPGQSIALAGASMGGLVSRYALLWMEDQAIDHQVRTWISFDSPQMGANIPLGLQAWVRFFASEAEEADFLLSRLRTPAARQMLLYHVDSTMGTTAAPDLLLAALNAGFDALGGWPQLPRRASIINGSGLMADQGFNAGDQVIEWEHRSLLVDIDGNVWAVPDGGSQVIFEGMIDVIIVGGDSEDFTVSGTLPWDNSPGGSRPSMQQAADVEAPYGDIVALHGSHNFIPSVSSLALATNDPFYDIAGDPNLVANTPFDAVYYPAANQEHIEITAENKAWFISEVWFGFENPDAIFNSGFEAAAQ